VLIEMNIDLLNIARRNKGHPLFDI